MRRRRLPEPFVYFVYFVDECLGRHVVPDALKAVLDPSERLVVMPQGTLDPDWIPLADKGGWICFTKDRALSRMPNERRALLSANAAIFMVGEASVRFTPTESLGACPCCDASCVFTMSRSWLASRRTASSFFCMSVVKDSRGPVECAQR